MKNVLIYTAINPRELVLLLYNDILMTIRMKDPSLSFTPHVLG